MNKLVFSKVSSFFLISLIFFSVFSVGVYSQDASVKGSAPVDTPDLPDETGSSVAGIDCALALCQDGYVCEEERGCVLREITGYSCDEGQYYDFVNEECRLPEFMGEVEHPGFVEGMFRGMRYFLSNDEAKSRLSAEIGAEKLTELETALEVGDYTLVKSIAEEFGSEMQRAGEVMNHYYDGVDITYEDYRRDVIDPGFNIDPGSVIYRYTDIERANQQIIAEAEESKRRILSLVEIGKLTQEDADRIISAMSGPEKLATIIASGNDEVARKIASESNGEITLLDIEYRQRAENDAIGFAKLNYQDTVTSEDIARNRFTLERLKQQITESDERDFADIAPLYMYARMEQQDARNGLVDEDYSEAFDSYQTANYMIRTLENYFAEGESALDDVEGGYNNFEQINSGVEQKNTEVAVAYETEGVRDRLVEQYPQYRTDLDKEYTKVADMIVLEASIELVDDASVEKYKYQGMSEEEAIAKVEGLKAEEYFYADGGTYYPIGYTQLSDANGDGSVNVEYGGGFVQGMSYSDTRGTTYQYGSSGYLWNSPLTRTEYPINYAADYNPRPMEHGSETYSYTSETEDGNYQYNYYPTGYTVTNPDGTTKEVSYGETVSTATFVGGGEARYGLYNYDFIYNGEATRFTENPAYGNYMDLATGYTYAPGIMHHENPVYNSEERVYEYELGGVNVDFNPTDNSFEFDDSAVINPPVPSAPIGLEDEVIANGQIVTEHGETLTYDLVEGVWTSETVDSETQEEVVTEFLVAPNQVYLHDEEDGVYLDSNGDVVETATLAGENWEETPGGNWFSESGVIYNPIEGTIEGTGDSSSGSRVYGAEYDSEGSEVARYTFRTDGRFVFNPALGTRGDYEFVSRAGIPGYDPINPPTREQTLSDGTTVTWTADPFGRYYVSSSVGQTYYGYQNYMRNEQFAEVGRTVTGDDGQIYRVTSDRGWTNSEDIAVPPPVVNGAQQPSSAGAGRYGAYSDFGSRNDRNYNYVYTNPDTGEQTALWLPPGVAPDSANSEIIRAQIEMYAVRDARGYDSTFGTSFGGVQASVSNTGYGDYGRGYGYYSGGSGQTYSSGFGHVRQEDGTWRAVTTASEADSLAGSSDYSPAGAYAGQYASRYQANVRTENGIETQTGVNDARIYQKVDGQWIATERYDTTQTPSSYGGYGYPSGGYGYSTGAGSGYSGQYVAPQGGYTAEMDSAAQAAGYASAAAAAAAYASSYSGGYNPAAAAAGWPGGAYPGGVAPYSGQYTGPVSGGYPGGPGSYYPGYSSSGTGAYGGAYDSSGNYVGGSYGGYDSSGAYVGTYSGSGYTGGSGGYYDSSGTYVSGGSSTGGDSGSSYTGGTYTGGDSGGSYTGSSTGGDSGGTTSGGDSGSSTSGSTSGGDSSGGSTGGGAVIAGENAKLDTWFARILNKLFGRS
ncbi:MAG: hypothetical protein AABW89_00945 [Nanoarchaeota archaeon]